MAFEYTPCQKKAFELLLKWWKSSSKQYFVLAGYAGTGKSSIVKDLIDELAKQGRGSSNNLYGDLAGLSEFLDTGNGKFSVKYVTFTGKASQVLRRKGLPATTIHKLIYQPVEKNNRVEFILKPASDLAMIDLIVVDEASMITKKMFRDLLSFNIPMILLGDLGQLPNTENDGFNIMEEYDTFMTSITRQGLDSPIIQLSMMAREGKPIKNKIYGDGVMKASISRISMNALLRGDQIICAKNDTRIKLNNLCRTHLGHDDSPYPVEGDKILCRKNNYDSGLINGMIGTCNSDSSNIIESMGSLSFGFDAPEDNVSGYFDSSIRHFHPEVCQSIIEVAPHFDKELDRFDYGFAITGHASQGSQYEYPIIIDEAFGDEAFRRKLKYTMYTRAISKLVILEGSVDQLIRKINATKNSK